MHSLVAHFRYIVFIKLKATKGVSEWFILLFFSTSFSFHRLWLVSYYTTHAFQSYRCVLVNDKCCVN